MATPLFWLPGLSGIGTAAFHGAGGEATADLVIPQLTPDLIRRQLDALTRERDVGLATRPVEEIVGVIDTVARRFLSGGDPLREEARRLLPLVTGYSEPMCARVLDRMAADWLAPRLERLLEEELGDPRAMDGFVARSGSNGFVHAVGPRLTFHIFSGNVPGVAVTSLVRALLVKSASLGKTASEEPVLPVLFARGIAEADASIGRCLAVAYWPGGTEELERVAHSSADTVIAYGSNQAVEAVRRRMPAGGRLLAYGSRISFAVVGREALSSERAAETAADAAVAVATFDQQGCVSPHLIYAEEGGETSPQAWTTELARAMARVEAELPRGSITDSEAAAIQQLRGRAELGELAGTETRLHRSADGTDWTVVYDPDPGFELSCLNRVVRVKPFGSPSEVTEAARSVEGLLQTVGWAGEDERFAPLALELARLGVSRLAPLREMPWPAPWWHHDGRPPLGDLVHWCDWDRQAR